MLRSTELDADRPFWIQIDMEKLAENMQKMTEDDLLLVVQMIHDNKTADTWTKNDVDRKYGSDTNLVCHE